MTRSLAAILAALATLAPVAVAEPERARFALCIGIDHYPLIDGGDLSGAVNDAEAMAVLLGDRFGFEGPALLLDEAATRAGILAAFEALHRRVDRARAAGIEDVTALVFYAGHGSQVDDQPDAEGVLDERDGRDETWVPHDSSWSLANDVLDDEVDALLAALAATGAQVILISDSCHSGSVHRSAAWTRARSLRAPEGDVDAPRAVPPDRATLALGPARPGAAPRAGFVAYTACADLQQAWEHVDEAGRRCGRFSWVLRRVLTDIDPGASFEAVHRRTAATFARLFPDGVQQPQFHASAAKRGERFLVGGYPPPHARVSGHRGDDVVLLDRGQLHGVGVGARVTLFADLDSLQGNGDPVASGSVTEVDMLGATVTLDGGAGPAGRDRAEWVARVDAAEMRDLVVRVEPSLPPAARERLESLVATGRLAQAAGDEPYDLAVGWSPAAGELELRSPTALAARGNGPQPPTLRVSVESLDDLPDRLEEHLRYLARSRRLMTLEREEGSVRLELAGEAVESDGATTRVADGSAVTLRFENPTRRRLFVHVLVLDPNGDASGRMPPGGVELLFPRPGDEPEAVPALGSLDLARFRATAETSIERTTLKVIASAEPLDLYALLQPPRPGGPSRGDSDPLSAILSEALHGGAAATRGLTLDPGPLWWSTSTLVFDVVREGPSPSDSSR